MFPPCNLKKWSPPCLFKLYVIDFLRFILDYFRGKEATNTGSGPEFFGFSHPTIQYLLQSLPNARKCSKYQWVKFELPKTKLLGILWLFFL